jgi:transglutaminase-like putative cysteine protease
MKNKQIFIIFFVGIFVFSSYLVFSEPIDYGKSIINVKLSSEINSDRPVNMKINLTSVPINDERQEVSSKYVFPESSLVKESEQYVFESSGLNKFSFGWDAVFETKVYLYNLQDKKFPTKISVFSDYTKETEYIDLDYEIIKKANELVSGKTSLNSAVLSLAEFVNTNMTYDLTFVGQNQKASFILENKKGVCSQYTVLLMALLRALGIPTRYVSGIAYSNLNNDFGNHAWLEFYNGDIWIPLDPTYGEYFYLDSSHVAFSKSKDIESGIYVSYTANADLTIEEVKIESSSQEAGKSDYSINLQLEPYKSQFATNSFIPLKVIAKNDYDFIVPVQLTITKAPGVYGKNTKTILIPAKSSAYTYFTLEIPPGDENYLYKSTVEVKNQFEDSANVILEFSEDYNFISLKQAQEIVHSEEQGIDYINDILFECLSSTKYYNNPSKISCKIISQANIPLYNLNICLESECMKIDLPINSQVQRNFSINSVEKKEYYIEIKNFDKKIPLKFNFIEKPEPKIISFEPANIEYKKNDVRVNIETNSEADCILYLNTEAYSIKDLKSEDYELIFSGASALSGKIKAKLECTDIENEKYTDGKIFYVNVKNIPFFGKIRLFFINLFNKDK